MKNKYKFFHAARSMSSFLICPQCEKRLQRFDIEDYMTCPYCDYRFEHSPELESFVLQPLVNEWMRQIASTRHDHLSGYVSDQF